MDTNNIDKDQLIKMLQNIQQQLGKQSNIGDDYSLEKSMGTENTKLIECRHEIIISVLATVMEEDEEGKTIGTKQIAKQTYHIPVPSNRNHEEYLKGFFNFIENCMSTSAEKMESNEGGNTNG